MDERRATRDLVDLPLDAVLVIFQYIGPPETFLGLSEVCLKWNAFFSKTDPFLWRRLSVQYRVPMHFPVNNGRQLRSKSDLKTQFWTSYQKKHRWIRERHENLLLQSKLLLEKKRDPAKQLSRLITSTFSDIADFDVNWQGSLIENNTLLTLASRYCHVKSVMLLVEKFGANINLCDVGGFSPLVILAYHGNVAGVKYCVKRGADVYQMGKLRSGVPLSAEHWASVKNHQEVFLYLRAMRLRLERGKPIAGHATWKMILKDAISNSNSERTDDSAADLSQGNNSTSEERGESTQVDNQHNGTAGDHFCVCLRGFEGQMIACDSSSCVVEWYHFGCVGLVEEVSSSESSINVNMIFLQRSVTQQPTGEWLCPRCRGDGFDEPKLARSGPSRSSSKKRKRSDRKSARSDGVEEATDVDGLSTEIDSRREEP